MMTEWSTTPQPSAHRCTPSGFPPRGKVELCTKQDVSLIAHTIVERNSPRDGGGDWAECLELVVKNTASIQLPVQVRKYKYKYKYKYK